MQLRVSGGSWDMDMFSESKHTQRTKGPLQAIKRSLEGLVSSCEGIFLEDGPVCCLHGLQNDMSCLKWNDASRTRGTTWMAKISILGTF